MEKECRALVSIYTDTHIENRRKRRRKMVLKDGVERCSPIQQPRPPATPVSPLVVAFQK